MHNMLLTTTPIVTEDLSRCEAGRGGGETSRATAAGCCSGIGRFDDRRFPSPVLRPPGWGPIMPARDVAYGLGGTSAVYKNVQIWREF